MSFAEFADLAEEFARKNKDVGTLSHRHLLRLIAGKGPKGTPLAPVRPHTARLLEGMLNISIERLLGPPDNTSHYIDLDLSGRSPKPLTVAVAVVVRESDVLTVCRRATHDDDITWQFPAGVVKPGVPAKSVAIRETLSETGVRCSVSRHLGARVHPVTYVVCDYMLCEYVSGDATNSDSEENLSVAWVSRERLDQVIPREHIYPPVLEALGIA